MFFSSFPFFLPKPRDVVNYLYTVVVYSLTTSIRFLDMKSETLHVIHRKINKTFRNEHILFLTVVKMCHIQTSISHRLIKYNCDITEMLLSISVKMCIILNI